MSDGVRTERGLDPVTLQVLVGGLRAACDEMGAVLIHSAHSPNITERRDCSTALFDAGGELVMQAEHIPVHLGSMPDAVAAVLDREQRPGDLWVLNDPYRGGTHLPDITLISPIFTGAELLGFAASRAHHLDFGGTAEQVEGNLNCPLPVTKSAAFFAVRVLTDPDAPPCAGAHRPVEVVAPEGSLLNARAPAAVAAGNVETSSRVADLVMDALAGAVPAPAQGQGTMNNLTLAGGGFTYYETVGGGQGACPQANGPSAVHVAMSNTLNTPVESLETEFPVRVGELSLRRGSGGCGRRRGGDGIVRELEGLAPMSFTLITERRRHAPRGRAGGADGEPGRNLLNGGSLPSKAAGGLCPGGPPRARDPR